MQQSAPALYARTRPLETRLRIAARGQQLGLDIGNASTWQWWQFQLGNLLPQHAGTPRSRLLQQCVNAQAVCIQSRSRKPSGIFGLQ